VKKDAVIALIAVVLVVAASWVLASVRPDRPLTPSKPFVAGSGGHVARKKIAPNDKVIMHVNGEPITESEFNTFATQAPAESRQFYLTPQGRRMLADELVKLKTLEQEGRRLGIDNDPDVRSQLDSIAAQIVAGKTLEKLVKESMDQKVAAEYAKEKGTTKTLRHILVAYQGSQVPPKSGAAPPMNAAMQKATAIVAKIRSGMDFALVARTDSDDQQTAANGGVLGAARPDQLPPDIAAVVNTLKPGQVSDPVRTEFGIHIFRVDEPSLAEMRPMLEQKVQREVMTETVERLQKTAKVELDDKFFPPAPVVPQPQQQQPQPSPKSNG
jgi:peptidyl-prolyl cis-trans isomerase C